MTSGGLTAEKKPRHVLVIEDHEDTQALLEILLRNRGFTFDATAGATEARRL